LTMRAVEKRSCQPGVFKFITTAASHLIHGIVGDVGNRPTPTAEPIAQALGLATDWGLAE
jgi:hypothetical protein